LTSEAVVAGALANSRAMPSTSPYRCVMCSGSRWSTSPTLWRCTTCGHGYPCRNGIPALYVEEQLGDNDRVLRDRLYNGFLGRYYQHVMPFLSLPVRPARASWTGWVAFALIVGSLVASTASLVGMVLGPEPLQPGTVQVAAVAWLLVAGWLLARHPYLFYLLVLAIPVRVSSLLRPFRPTQSFAAVHARIMRELAAREHLQVLDICTGTGNSLYRHGWMALDAAYTGLDLSATMLRQGQQLMAERGVAIDLVQGDAARLPFRSQVFDVVLDYGAVNGFADPKVALAEMARVAKPGGVMLFLDEQLDGSASWVERLYFRKVLSSHNVVHHCPVESLPATLKDVEVHQVYRFYYLCVART
jgi:SAM-dependent methyltransferase